LARKDEISSTEKLLNLIRENPSSVSPPQPIESAYRPPSEGFFTSLRFQKSFGIGVEIGRHEIRIAKINRLSDKSFELIDTTAVSVEPFGGYDTPHLAKALAAVLSRCCSGLKRFDIWCCVASAKVETRCIRIPKLPKKQIPNAVFWTFSKEVAFNENEMLLDFRILGDVKEGGMAKTQVMTFTIPISETKSLKRLFTTAGYPLTGISIVPFAIQNLLKTAIVKPVGDNTCCLFIGRDWSRITIYSDGNLVLSRGIKAGMQSMIDAIAEQFRQQPAEEDAPPSVTDDLEIDFSEDQDNHESAAREAFLAFLNSDRTPDPAPESRDETRINIFETILPATERLVKQVERTVAHFALHFKGSSITEILISGKVTGNSAIIDYIAAQLDLPVRVLDPFPEQHPFSRRVVIPKFPSERESFVPAIGIGLSSNNLTPNFLFTHRHREKNNRARQLRIGISAACIGLLALLLCTFLWQEDRLSRSAAEVAQLTRQRDAFSMPLTQDLVMALYAKVNRKRKQIGTLSNRYYTSAVMAEVSQRTPENIRLIAVNARKKGISRGAKKKADATLTIEGLVTGNQIRFETDLASYMFAMEASPLFDKPVVASKRIQYLKERPVLRFTLQLMLS